MAKVGNLMALILVVVKHSRIRRFVVLELMFILVCGRDNPGILFLITAYNANK